MPGCIDSLSADPLVLRGEKLYAVYIRYRQNVACYASRLSKLTMSDHSDVVLLGSDVGVILESGVSW